ncbi:MAG: GNAT family protein [Bacillota bacterium]|nr:GNAT family protein [Bacillota bacterium]
MYQDAFSTFPILETKNLILRKLNESDAETMQEYLQDPLILSFTDYPSHFEVLDVIKIWNNEAYNPNGMIRWCIALKANNRCIGNIYIFNPHGDEASGRRMDIGYEISPQYRNNGYATEAIKRVVLFGFEKMGLKRVQAQVIPENIASIKVCEKSGFIKEGTLRNYCHYQFSSKLKTMVMMACIPSDLGIEDKL